jgi:hypothetical protein
VHGARVRHEDTRVLEREVGVEILEVRRWREDPSAQQAVRREGAQIQRLELLKTLVRIISGPLEHTLTESTPQSKPLKTRSDRDALLFEDPPSAFLRVRRVRDCTKVILELDAQILLRVHAARTSVNDKLRVR